MFEKYVEKLGPLDVIAATDLSTVAKEQGLSLLDAQIAALGMGIVPRRYVANVRFIGAQGQQKLLRSAAAIVGCGALGGMLCELLSRLGVGRLDIIDFDVFDETNLNRQIMCVEEDIGRSKVICAKERAMRINPALTLHAHNVRFDASNAQALISNSDVALDGLDNAPDKLLLEKTCLSGNIPLVHGAIGDSMFQVATIRDDSLLGNLYAGGTENPVAGTPPCTAAACASLQAGEVLKILLGIGDIADGAILKCDWLFWSGHVIRI